MVRTFEFCRFNIKSFINAISSQSGVEGVVVFCTFWDHTNEAGFIRNGNELRECNDIEGLSLAAVNKDRISSFCKELESDNVKISLKFLDFSDDRHPNSSFMFLIHESYKHRLEYEIDNNEFFERIVLTRPDVILCLDNHDTSLFSDLITTITTINEKLNILNDEPIKTSKTSAAQIKEVRGNRHWFKVNREGQLDDFHIFLFSLIPVISDFFFYGNRREMNMLMRAYMFATATNSFEQAHSFLSSYLMKKGVIMSNQLIGPLRPLIVKRIYDVNEMSFCDNFETIFANENTNITSISSFDKVKEYRNYISKLMSWNAK